MDNLEIEDLAMIAILLDEDEAAKKKVVKKENEPGFMIYGRKKILKENSQHYTMN
jgi:hypothetical protein